MITLFVFIACPFLFGSEAELRHQWTTAFLEFMDTRSELTAEQAEVLESALAFGSSEQTTLFRDGVRDPFARSEFVALLVKLRSRFTRTELGNVFTSMGDTYQLLLNKGAFRTPYCNCTGTGACTNIPGSCVSGCITWDPPSGGRYTGICSDTGDETEPTPEKFD